MNPYLSLFREARYQLHHSPDDANHCTPAACPVHWYQSTIVARAAMCHIFDMQKPNHLTLRIEQQTSDRLQRLSTARNLSVGWLVRRAVEEFLAREEKAKT